MAEPFIGEIRMMSFNYPPKGWALCNGQLMAINQNQALFSLLGTNYGGDGRVNFGLPNLEGRVPMHTQGSQLPPVGEVGGEYAHTLSIAELTAHVHGVQASSATQSGNQSPTGRYLGGGGNVYHPPGALSAMRPSTVASTGGGQPHDNTPPYLTISFCIALQGIFPSQT
jgi:microcystin-dependent protein